jgi:hypothetical protein
MSKGSKIQFSLASPFNSYWVPRGWGNSEPISRLPQQMLGGILGHTQPFFTMPSSQWQCRIKHESSLFYLHP